VGRKLRHKVLLLVDAQEREAHACVPCTCLYLVYLYIMVSGSVLDNNFGIVFLK
jgi:hypothetical protein